MSASNNESVVIKKYANRRLYNTATSTYVTLENLAEMVKTGTEFNVYDAKSNEDITHDVLTQIAVEKESNADERLLPIDFLRRLIGFQGNSDMQWFIPKYLEHSMQMLSKHQEQIRDYYQTTFGSIFPFGNTLEQMSKQNLAMFERTMQMFSPFSSHGSESGEESCCCVTQGEAASEASDCGCAKTREEARGKTVEPVSPTPINLRTNKKQAAATVSLVPTPETTRATAQSGVSGEDVQNKIAALQRQLSELAKNKG
ncbi:MAG: polyhydroxyalkanoate synthesis repressor PhaR [Alphaproteobacteria bacterium]|nr:polyhydroxyalkanoate synthesis repressor PhaR [Alphaproteobacteria bacterium]